MHKFYVNLFPIKYNTKDGVNQTIGVGTSFTIVGIFGDQFEIQPVKKIIGLGYPLMFGVQMLEVGFKGEEYLNNFN